MFQIPPNLYIYHHIYFNPVNIFPSAVLCHFLLIFSIQVYLERVSELDNITKSRDEVRNAHDDLRKKRLNNFMEG